MTTLKNIFKNPSVVIPILGHRGFFHSMPDEKYIRLSFKGYMGRDIDFNNPRSFNEKLQWLKLHDRNPLYTMLVDKYRVKEWVADRIGSEYVTETYVAWESVEDIDISALPERFVLKTNHDSGGVVICRDRTVFDLNAAKRKLSKHLNENYYWGCREWPYRNVKPLVFAEEYLDSNTVSKDSPNHKLFHFSNSHLIAPAITDRIMEAGLTKTFFDEEWYPLEVSKDSCAWKLNIPMPRDFGLMKKLSDEFASSYSLSRVGFYGSRNRLLFGEIAVCSNSGFERFNPAFGAESYGTWMELPSREWLLVNEFSLLWVHENYCPDVAEEQIDYKFYCFDGEPRFIYVSQGLERHETARIDFLNMDWERASFGRPDYASFEAIPSKPDTFDEMTGLVKELSKNMPFVRVDFFEYKGRPRFSEMTFHPCGGFMPFDPPEWDEKVGDMLTLPR
ncbi:hypothetical protein ET524_09835 [Senegalimassilia faecalis]|uniref:Glycosyl transferase n=1 Tax=Senegalimassilia faecalis TaxID=2509433 RepID=A0A4V1QU51_9ACTN|nr:ATP-grasp fold amidoligase family protein [Senegalimassilia faecalis]RXZ54747.1 hypothetical protein ET524_09835 [Senegalimassilia faecalis]